MDLSIILISVAISFTTTLFVCPLVIKKMTELNIFGIDINKKDKRKIPEMGGISAIIGITATMIVFFVYENLYRAHILLSLTVLFLVAAIGILDDLKGLSQKRKAVLVAAASLPIILLHPVNTVIDLPFGFYIYFSFYIYFFILVPLGITGPANALNMSAGYNGLESGEAAIISFFLLLISLMNSASVSAYLIFSSVFGASLALYYFHRYPARTFIGDVGTLSLGALIGLGTILGKIEFYGVIAILPSFFELFSTVYHNLKGVNRREACMNPIILDDGKLKAPEGTKWYTLAYFILNKRELGEKNLVMRMLSIYFLSGFLALVLSLF